MRNTTTAMRLDEIKRQELNNRLIPTIDPYAISLKEAERNGWDWSDLD